jgi:hypothetical protein
MRAIIREELSRHRGTELGIVTEVFARDSESGDNNHQVSIRLRSTGVELQRAPVVVGRAGFSLLPRSGDLVVVSYVDGDMNAPVVIGSLYDSESQRRRCTSRPRIRIPRHAVSIWSCRAAPS